MTLGAELSEQMFLSGGQSRRETRGRGSRAVWVSDRGLPCHEFEHSATKDPPCRESMHVKSVESKNVVPLVWCGT
ncbi:hypothetical protein TNCV_3050101 [Trichonephila clavipes]|nr:hypothetical protein TNCV_3050101 [Trichonephila clavipes]